MMMTITAVQIDPPKLHKTIVTHFGLDDLRDLCFDLSLDFDELPPGGKSAKARGLVETCQRQRRLVALAEAVLEQRPNIAANEFLRDLANNNAPFKGMLAFEEADEEIFYGREALTEELVARVSSAEPTNFLAIVGASGSGKSSVVRAGMVPQLRRQTKWLIHLITPTAHPLQALATSLTRDSESVTAADTLIDDLQKIPRALRLYTVRLLQESKVEQILLVIDQFEELFTLCKDETERTAFVENLVDAVAEDNQITILLTLRADFYHHCLQYRSLHRLLEQQQKIVPPMSGTELRAAIELPAKQANLTFEGGLVDILLRDVGAADNQTPEPGALPLLSHALLETWQRRDPNENRLTLAGYTEAGGVQGAIAKTAESTYQRLPADQQKIARSIFLRLTELGEGTQDTRRRAALAELLPQNDARATVEQVLKTLADARLLTTSDDGAEVAHEALIRQWPTLQSWLDEDRDGLRLHRQLTEASQAWVKNYHDKSYLYHGGRLAQANDWVQTGNTDLNQLETDFLQVSQKQQHDELAEANARAEREAEAAQKLRQRAIFLRGALVLAAILAIIAFLLFGQSTRRGREAIEAQGTAEANQITADSRALAAFAGSEISQKEDPSGSLALLLAMESVSTTWSIDNTVLPESYTALSLAIENAPPWIMSFPKEGSSEDFNSATWSQDGTRILASSQDNQVFIWDTETGKEIMRLPGQSDAWNSDGARIVTTDVGDVVHIWDTETGMELNQLDSLQGRVLSVEWNSDDVLIATASGRNVIQIWSNTSEIAQLDIGGEGVIWDVGWSPDKRFFAVSMGVGGVLIWDIETEQEIQRFSSHSSFIRAIAWSPDGKYLATGGDDSIVRIWDVITGQEKQGLIGHTGWISSIDWSSDSSHIATSSIEGTARIPVSQDSADWSARIWNVETGVEEKRFLGHNGWVNSVEWSPDGKYLLTSSFDGTVRVWSTQIQQRLPILTGHTAAVWTIEWSSNGKQLLSSSTDETTRIWDVISGNQLESWFSSETWASWNSDDSQVLTVRGKSISTIGWLPSIWDPQSGREIKTIGNPKPDTWYWDMGWPEVAAWNPLDSRIAIGSRDGMISIWDSELNEELIRFQGHAEKINSIAWSPDGKLLVTASSDNSVRIWDANDGKETQRFIGHSQEVLDANWSPDGSQIVSASVDQTARVWDVETGQEVIQLIGHDDTVASVDWSPDATRIATVSWDKTVRIWDAQTGSELLLLLGHKNAVLWVDWNPEGNKIATASADGTVRIWLVDIEEMLLMAKSLIQRNPPIFYQEERLRFLGEK